MESPTPGIDRLSTLPAELSNYPAIFLDIKDTKNLRVASSAFQDAALKRLFRTIYLRPKQQSIQNLRQITDCPDLHGLVKNLAVDLIPLWRSRREDDGRRVQVAGCFWDSTEPDSGPQSSYADHSGSIVKDEATRKWAFTEFFQLLGFSSHAFHRAIRQLSSLD